MPTHTETTNVGASGIPTGDAAARDPDPPPGSADPGAGSSDPPAVGGPLPVPGAPAVAGSSGPPAVGGLPLPVPGAPAVPAGPTPFTGETTEEDALVEISPAAFAAAVPQAGAGGGAAAGAGAGAAAGPAPAAAPAGSGVLTLIAPSWAWAGSALSLEDRGHLTTAWEALAPIEREQAAYQLTSYLNVANEAAVRLTRDRTEALARLSGSFRRLQAGGTVESTLGLWDEGRPEEGLVPPRFLLPLLSALAVALFERARRISANSGAPSRSVMGRILGGRGGEGRRALALRLFQRARGLLVSRTDDDTVGLATALALVALESTAEVARLKIGGTSGQNDGSSWLTAILPYLEATRPAFVGKLSLLVDTERSRGAPGPPAGAAASGGAPLLDTQTDELKRLARVNRAPSYAPEGKGWAHPDAQTTRDWTGECLVPVRVSPYATQLAPPTEARDYVKKRCPPVVGDKLLGNQCASCATKTIVGGCVWRFDMAERGPACQQGHLSPLETPTLAIPWNLRGEVWRPEDEDERGFPRHLDGGRLPGWPQAEDYGPEIRPCPVPDWLRGRRADARATGTGHTVRSVRRRPRPLAHAPPDCPLLTAGGDGT